MQPLVAGFAVQGKAVQASTGVWSPTPAKVTYEWLRCNRNGRVCGRIANASGSSYTLGAADVGHALVALVQASFGTTAQSAYSVATPVAVAATVVGPSLVAGPTVSGTAAQSRQLTASPGTWSGLGPGDVRLPVVPLRPDRLGLRRRSAARRARRTRSSPGTSARRSG